MPPPEKKQRKADDQAETCDGCSRAPHKGDTLQPCTDCNMSYCPSCSTFANHRYYCKSYECCSKCDIWKRKEDIFLCTKCNKTFCDENEKTECFYCNDTFCLGCRELGECECGFYACYACAQECIGGRIWMHCHCCDREGCVEKCMEICESSDCDGKELHCKNCCDEVSEAAV